MSADALLSLPQIGSFLAVALMLTVAPGPDNLLVIALGMARGRRSGLAFGLGCALGCLNHTLLAALGVSALVAASPAAFMTLRIAGGVYLIWLGIQAIARAQPSTGPAAVSEESLPRLFAKGLVANAINPKVILFFLALLPQFVDPGRGNAGWQIAQLGSLFALVAVLVFGALGWFAGTFGERLTRQPVIGVWLDRAAGAIFIALGIRLAILPA